MTRTAFRVPAALGVVRGVSSVRFDADESLISVRFNVLQTSLGEIVRVIEDTGAVVESVAQRRSPRRLAG
jgi:copper chaperone CopZ